MTKPTRDGPDGARWLGRRGLRITLCPTRALVALERKTTQRHRNDIWLWINTYIYIDTFLVGLMNIHFNPAMTWGSGVPGCHDPSPDDVITMLDHVGYPIFELNHVGLPGKS